MPPLIPSPHDFPQYIAVEGPIGVGKTTLVQHLAERFGAQTILEIFEENPFLASFYQEPERFAFQTEMFFLLSRYRQQETFGAQVDLFSRLHVSDYLFVKCRLFASLTLGDHELGLYDRMYQILMGQVVQPDLVIHLTAPTDTLMERIKARGRSYEQTMDRLYLERLSNLYHSFFDHYEDAPVLEVDTRDVHFAQDPGALDALIGQIRARWRRGRLTQGASLDL